jgi:hypothetical protein
VAPCRLRTTILIGFTALLLASCARSVEPASVRSGALPATGASRDDLASPMIDSVGGVDLYPPPAGATPSVSAEAARQSLVPVAGPLSSSAFVAKLALLPYTQNATENSAPATSYEDRLVWAFIGEGEWSQSDSHLGAVGPNGQAVTPSFPAGTICTGVWLVDATSGSYLEGYSYCPGEGQEPGTSGP